MDYNNEEIFDDDEKSLIKIKVVGVGGGGGNAVNRMIDAGITSAEFAVVNTDKQALMMFRKKCQVIQIGEKLTSGQGAGADPNVGEKAAEESRETLKKMLEGVDLLFITAGMGGGTGTGAAPVIAKLSREMGILTVAIVTKPFVFEGSPRMKNALKGIEKLREFVDALLVVPNNKLMQVLPKSIPIVQAFKEADEVLRKGIQGISDLIATPSMINSDFADVKNIIKGPCSAHLGVGEGTGENRAITAVQQAVKSPLLETSIIGARGVILNIMGGMDMTLEEVDIASNLIHSVVDESANIIIGVGVDSKLEGKIVITLIATGGIKDSTTVKDFDEDINKKIGELKNRKFDQEEPEYVPLGEIPSKRQPQQQVQSDEFVSRPALSNKDREMEDDDNTPAFIRKLRANRGH